MADKTKNAVVKTEKSASDIKTDSNPIYCANCIHCKIIPAPAETSGFYYLRVHCDAGKWRKKLGEEKIYKYFTVARRSIASCDSYEDMGDPIDFLHDLKTTLPDHDEIYSR